MKSSLPSPSQYPPLACVQTVNLKVRLCSGIPEKQGMCAYVSTCARMARIVCLGLKLRYKLPVRAPLPTAGEPGTSS